MIEEITKLFAKYGLAEEVKSLDSELQVLENPCVGENSSEFKLAHYRIMEYVKGLKPTGDTSKEQGQAMRAGQLYSALEAYLGKPNIKSQFEMRQARSKIQDQKLNPENTR